MTSCYNRHIMPRLIRYGCGCELIAERRAAIIPQAAGRVLELGIGGGLNLKFYNPATVSELIGIDPSTELRAYAQAAPRPAGLRVQILDASAESLPFPPDSFDTVVTTLTLCTVPDAMRALAEASRMLRPGGRLLFCEHGAAPDPGVARWQRRLDPLWGALLGGCHLTRPVGPSISRFFTMERLQTATFRAPRVSPAGMSGAAPSLPNSNKASSRLLKKAAPKTFISFPPWDAAN